MKKSLYLCNIPNAEDVEKSNIGKGSPEGRKVHLTTTKKSVKPQFRDTYIWKSVYLTLCLWLNESRKFNYRQRAKQR